jgi:intron-binding protein aquarius
MGLEIPPAMAQNLETRPSVSDLQEDSRWVNLAKAHWLKKGKARKVKQDFIKKEIWDPLEAQGFSLHSLLILENLNVLEK